MTSCSNDDTDFIERKAPVAPAQEQANNESGAQEDVFNIDPYTIEFASFKGQDEAINITYVIETADNTYEVNPMTAESTTLSKGLRFALVNIKNVPEEIVDNDLIYTRFVLPATTKGTVNISIKSTAAEGHENFEKHNISFIYRVKGDTNSMMMRGLKDDALDKFVTRMNNRSTYSYEIR